MLSDEEKKVIDLLKNIDKQKCMMLKCPVVKNNIERQLKIIELNRTIRKQSKEIEQLNKSDAIFAISNLIAENKELKEEIEELKKYEKYYEEMEEVNKKFIAVDKIKAKIEIRKEEKENCKDSIEEKYLLREIYALQSLLGKE